MSARTPEQKARAAAYARVWRAANPALSRVRVKAYREKYPERVRARRQAARQARLAKDPGLDRRYRYGLTLEGWNWLLEQQGGACALCDRDATCVDHDHATGLPRALLCTRCNTGVGYVESKTVPIGRLIQYVAAYS